jgi:hypothetical protein
MISYCYSFIRDFERASQYVELALDIGRSTLITRHRYIQMAEEHQLTLREMQDASRNCAETVNK